MTDQSMRSDITNYDVKERNGYTEILFVRKRTSQDQYDVSFAKDPEIDPG